MTKSAQCRTEADGRARAEGSRARAEATGIRRHQVPGRPVHKVHASATGWARAGPMVLARRGPMTLASDIALSALSIEAAQPSGAATIPDGLTARGPRNPDSCDVGRDRTPQEIAKIPPAPVLTSVGIAPPFPRTDPEARAKHEALAKLPQEEGPLPGGSERQLGPKDRAYLAELAARAAELAVLAPSAREERKATIKRSHLND
jgi:hypothetical protein